MNISRTIGIALFFSGLGACMASAQSWQALQNQPDIETTTMLLLRDGRVMANEGNTGKWNILTPDSTGSYVNGTWSHAANMPTGYAPYYFSSAVLPDGRLIVEGGEENNGVLDRTNLGAIYDPAADTWTSVNPPTGWVCIGDATSVLLANGTYMQANHCTTQVALLNAKNLTWTETGHTLVPNDEQGWALLPNGQVLMPDAQPDCGSNMSTEIYDPGSGTWSCGPQMPVQLWGYDLELGSTVLTYNGTVVQFGGLISGTGVFNLASNTWSLGPDLPPGMNQDDGPSALEPNGKILALLNNPHATPTGCQFVEYDPSSNTISLAPNPPQCPFGMRAVGGRLLVLPSGQILFSNFSHTLEVYTPAPGVVASAAPVIFPLVTLLYTGSVNNVLYGKQLNGLSQACMYGDDAQQATNYPLVQLKDVNSGIVWWAKTHDDSSSTIAPNAVGYTKFDLNPKMPSGTFDLTVITNGIPANTVRVNVQSH